MNRLAMLALAVALALRCRLGRAAIEIDLAAGPGDWAVLGASRGDFAGTKAQFGDLNGDGITDLAISEPGWNDPGLGPNVGRISVFLGPIPIPAEVDLSSAVSSFRIVGDFPEAPLGNYVAIRDLDGDGFSDLLVGAATSGADGTKPAAGSLTVFRGRRTWPSSLSSADADWSFHGADAGDDMGYASVGDLNGDGAADIVLFAGNAAGPGEARESAGEAYIFFGPAAAWRKRVFDLATDVPDVTLYGVDGGGTPGSFGDTFGSGFAVSDVVDDAIADLIIGAGNADGPSDLRTNSGEVYVFRGRPAWPTAIDAKTDPVDLLVHGPVPFSFLSAAAVGDWDGDGRADLVLGAVGYVLAPPAREAAGSIHVLRGADDLAGVWDLAVREADERILGPREYAMIGHLVGLADVNGDGYLDIVGSSIGDNTPYIRDNAGLVFVVSGCEELERVRDLAVEPPELSVYGAEVWDQLGQDLSLSDADGDGKADILAGARFADGILNARPDSGEAHLVLGRPWGTVCTVAAYAGPDRTVCGGVDTTLDGGGTVVTGCARTPQYRWLLGASVVREWSTDSTAVVRPAASATYRLEVRCGDCRGPCSGSAEVAVAVDPDLVPGDLGNTLRAVRRGTDVQLSWGGDPLARTYVLHRGVSKGVWPFPPFRAGLSATTETLSDVSSPPSRYFYRATGASCAGREGA